MLPRISSSVARTFTKPASARPTIQKRYFGDPHADNGAEAVDALKMWKYVALITLVPSTAAFLWLNFIGEHEHALDLPTMPYKQVIYKKFPWGDGSSSLFKMWYQSGDHHHSHEH